MATQRATLSGIAGANSDCFIYSTSSSTTKSWSQVAMPQSKTPWMPHKDMMIALIGTGRAQKN
jgi:hypothetical protein